MPASDQDFIGAVWAQVVARGGDPDTPILLLCRSGVRARAAARDLTLAGLGDVHPISGGFEGERTADGRQSGGWKGALPWQPFIDKAVLRGPAH